MNNAKTSLYNVYIPVTETSEYLLYNTFNGGLEILSIEIGKILEKAATDGSQLSEIMRRDPEVFDALMERGYIVPLEHDERKSLQEFYETKRRLSFTQENATIALTIGATIKCNMGCSYCFQFERPNKSLRDKETFLQIKGYLKDMIGKASAKSWFKFHVTWFGGEPLVNKAAISGLTPLFLELCEEFKLKYEADIVTNGILLNEDGWRFLEKYSVQNVQVTIDGSSEIHDRQRPLKAENEKNYYQILENLRLLPEDIKLNIRVNMSRSVAKSIPKLFDELEAYDIWPRHYKTVTFTPAWLRTFEGENISEAEKSDRFSNDEFFDALQDFRVFQVERFNKWARNHNVNLAKLRWDMPRIQDDCPTWVSPYGMVIDPEGYLHKCWETFHHEGDRINHVRNGYDVNDFKRYTDYNRLQLNEECAGCKFLPVCDQLSCAVQTENEARKPPCTYWKNKLVPSFKQHYLNHLNAPNEFAAPVAAVIGGNKSHANK